MTRQESTFYRQTPHKAELRSLILMVHLALKEATQSEYEFWEQVQELFRSSNVNWDEIPSLSKRLSKDEVEDTLASAMAELTIERYNSSSVRKVVKALRQALRERLGEDDSAPHAPIILHAPTETPESIVLACYSQVPASRAVLDRLSNLATDQPRKRGIVRALCIERPRRNLDRAAQFAEIVDDDEWRPVLIAAYTTARRIYSSERWCGAVYELTEPPVQFADLMTEPMTVDCSSAIVGERYATDYLTAFKAWTTWCNEESLSRDYRSFVRYLFLYGALNLLPLLDYAGREHEKPVAHLIPRWANDLHGECPSSLANGKAVERLPYLLGVEGGVNVWELLGELVIAQAKADQKTITKLLD